MKIVLRILFVVNIFVSCSLPKSMTQIGNIPDVDRVSSKTSDYSFQGALENKFSRDNSAALDMILFSVETDSTNAAAYYELSNYDLFLKNNDKAMSAMRKSVFFNPDNVWYKYKLADFYVKNDSLEAAVSLYEDILGKSKETSLYYVLSSYYVKLKEYDKALGVIAKLENKEGETLDVFNQKLRIFYDKGDNSRIIKELEKRIKEKPYENESRMSLAQMYIENDSPEKAISLYRDILKENPYNTEMNVALLSVYERTDIDKYKKKVSEILSDASYSDDLKDFALSGALIDDTVKNDSVYIKYLFDDVVSKLDTENTSILLKYAQYLELKNRKDEVINVLERIYNIDPSIELVNYALFSYSIDNLDYENIYKYATQGIKITPQELTYYFYLSVYYLNKSDYDNALQTCLQAIPYISSKSQTELVAHIYSLIASLYHEKGDVQKCLEACEKALLYSPNNPTMLNDYAYFLALSGKELGRAEDMASKALEIKPDDINIVDTYAWVLFVKGDYSLALEYIEKAVSMSDDPGATVYEHAGDIYIMNNMPEKAMEMWNKAKECGSDSKTLDLKIKNKKYVKEE